MAVIRLTPRPKLLTVVVGVIAVAGVLAGCGTAAMHGSAASHAPAAKATLTIKVTNRANNTVTRWTLRCDPPGGTTPNPAAACLVLSGANATKGAKGAENAFLAQLRRHVMCPMIMVSARQIIVDGTWFGKKVHQVLIDGTCDLPIFNGLAKSLNLPRTVN